MDNSQLHQIQSRKVVNYLQVDNPDIEGDQCPTLADCRLQANPKSQLWNADHFKTGS